MSEIKTVAFRTMKGLQLSGRFDGLSATDIEKKLDSMILDGEREIIMDLTGISYISSAGLRVLLKAQKVLEKISGGLILLGVQPAVLQVLQVSGFERLFQFAEDPDHIGTRAEIGNERTARPSTFEINGARITERQFQCQRGRFFAIGNHAKLASSSYESGDVVAIRNSDILFGGGVAALGDHYQDFKYLFGEAMIVDGHFFVYPAVKRSSVDFMLKREMDPSLTFKFLQGFGFRGDYRSILQFDDFSRRLTLGDLIQISDGVVQASIYGLIIVAESAGIYGMNLRQVPIQENKPVQGEIFDQKNFADWIDYPLEMAFLDHVIIAVGLVVKDKSVLNGRTEPIFSKESRSHIHGAIFEKGALSKNIAEFRSEQDRIISDLNLLKIQHLLGKCQFKSGMAGIVELEAL